jgi:4-hydroxy-tetrahydrodipicolinate reductase
MLKIGLLGYGKMGKAIDALAPEHDIAVVWRIGSLDRPSLDTSKLREADVVIEFSRPESAYENVRLCLEAGVPVISGTTGWQTDLGKASDLCLMKGGAFLWASNFSVGVNLFFALNQYLALLMAQRTSYTPSLVETHHIHKLDAPSGTAISLLDQILRQVPRYQAWSLSPETTTDIPVTAIRSGEVPGTHLVRWSSEIDDITIEHKAHSRKGFASGALLAAQWIQDKKGVFSMADVLGLNQG